MRLRNGQKKSPRNIWKLSGKVLIFAPASREKRFSGALERVLKNIRKKIFRKDLVVRKITLNFAPLSHFKKGG